MTFASPLKYSIYFLIENLNLNLYLSPPSINFHMLYFLFFFFQNTNAQKWQLKNMQ